VIDVVKPKTIEERRAALIIKYRNLKVDREDREGDNIVYYLSRGDVKYVMFCVIDQNTIGISYVRDLKSIVDKEGADKGIIVGTGKYTYSAKSSAPKLGVELIPPTLPVFDIFKHELVPNAEIVTEEKKQELIEKYHAQPYQFPWIKTSDPISIILGAKPGDIIKFTTESETAGISESYRYVT
jgi:DNA-directed RNA polymerase subunit H